MSAHSTATASHNERILAHLMRGKSITPLEALKKFQCFRLGARIWDLKQLGIRIVSELIETKSGKHVARYSLPRRKRKAKSEKRKAETFSR